MRTQSRIRSVVGVVSPFILFVSLAALPLAGKSWTPTAMFPESENTFEFTNNETEDAYDLHIHWSRAVKVKQVKPFKKKERSGTSRTDLSNGVVKRAGKASVTVSWDGSGEPEVKEWWWTKNNGDRLGEIKTGNPTTASVPGAESKAMAAYTRDWQPGDEVSFSFSGIVYGPSGEKQTQEDYTGDFVGIVDSQGNKTEKPWSKVIRYKVAEGATSVTASLLKPDRTIITTANIPVHAKGTPLPIQLPPKFTGNRVAYPVSQIGQPYTVYAPNGGFSGDANKIKLRTTNKIDNATTESNAVAASPHSALFNPQVKEPGSYEYTVTDEGRFEDSFDVSAVGIKLDTSRAYRVNQEGTLAVIVTLPPQAEAQEKLFSENVQVSIEMETPSVLAFSNGQNEVLWSLQKSEVTNNQARKEFSVRAGAPGAFKITARAKTPKCSNPSARKTRDTAKNDTEASPGQKKLKKFLDEDKNGEVSIDEANRKGLIGWNPDGNQ